MPYRYFCCVKARAKGHGFSESETTAIISEQGREEEKSIIQPYPLPAQLSIHCGLELTGGWSCSSSVSMHKSILRFVMTRSFQGKSSTSDCVFPGVWVHYVGSIVAGCRHQINGCRLPPTRKRLQGRNSNCARGCSFCPLYPTKTSACRWCLTSYVRLNVATCC